MAMEAQKVSPAKMQGPGGNSGGVQSRRSPVEMARAALAYVRSHMCPFAQNGACCPITASTRSMWCSYKADFVRLAGLPVFWMLAVLGGLSSAASFAAGLLWVVSAPLLQRNCDFWTWCLSEKQEKFAGKVAWVTGAGAGRGLALCRLLALRGVKGIVMTDSDGERLKAAVTKIISHCKAQGVTRTSDDFLLLPLDMAKGLRPSTGANDANGDPEWQQAVQRAVEWRGGVDFLFNNADQVALGCFPSTETFAKIVDANLLSAVRLTNMMLPHMQMRNSGHIVFMNSAAAYINFGGFSAYATSKAALHTYANILRQDLHGRGFRGIHVTSIHLGCIQTSMGNFVDPRVDATRNQDNLQMPRGGLDVDVAVALLLRAVSRDLEEAWIAEPGYLTGMYASYYIPQSVRFARRFTANKECSVTTELRESVISQLARKD